MTSISMKLPQHTSEKSPRVKNGKQFLARAPYNFVPLPQQVVPAEGPPDHDRYQGNSGWIECEIETLTPLYVRGLLASNDFKEIGIKSFHELTPEQKNKRAEFFSIGNNVAIPGSSLRGMLRTLVEIAGFGKMQQVGNEQRFFYRAVAAPKDDSLGDLYKKQMGLVKAGYVERREVKENIIYFVHPVQKVDGKETYIKAQETNKFGRPGSTIDSALKYMPFDDSNYEPQYVEVSFTWKRTPNGRIVADKVGAVGKYAERGWMVCSGSMNENSKGKKKSPRRNHCIVPVKDTSANALPINKNAVDDYCAALTDFQKETPFSDRHGCLVDGRPIFYLDDGNDVIAFGHSPNFRLPFKRPRSQRASTVLDFIPEGLRSEAQVDVAEALFGYVKSNNQAQGKERTHAGRVFVSDANALPNQDRLMSTEVITPAILGSPKPSSFQLYLTQPDGAAREKLNLKHYASRTPDETVIRGHKLYWHRKIQGKNDFTWSGSDEKRKQAEKQLTGIKPVRPGVKFKFRVWFENLSDAELGALLWVVDLPKGHAHKLGMGKSLGLGSVRVTLQSLTISDRVDRYNALLTGDAWNPGASVGKGRDYLKKSFEEYVLRRLDSSASGNAQTLRDLPRIHELLCLLAYEDAPALSETRYLEIEHKDNGNEYKERPVLPLPSVILGKPAPVLKANPVGQADSLPSVQPQPIKAIPVQQNWRIGTVVEIRPDKRFGRVRDAETQKEYRFETKDIVGNTPANKSTVQFVLEDGKVISLKRR